MPRHVPIALKWDAADDEAVKEGKVTGFNLVAVVNDEPVLDINLPVDAKSYAFTDAKEGDKARFELYAVKNETYSDPAALEGEVKCESSLEAAEEKAEESEDAEGSDSAVEESKRVMFGEAPEDKADVSAEEKPETPSGFEAQCLVYPVSDPDFEGEATEEEKKEESAE